MFFLMFLPVRLVLEGSMTVTKGTAVLGLCLRWCNSRCGRRLRGGTLRVALLAELRIKRLVAGARYAPIKNDRVRCMLLVECTNEAVR